jgi:broad specificity phosphatase PhoE
MQILLIRHGQTAGDPYEEPDMPASGYLSEDGEKQALALRESLAGERINLIWTSRLGRAIRTAVVALDGHKVPVKHFAFLNEWKPAPEARNATSTVWEKMNEGAGAWEAEETWQSSLGEGTLEFLSRVGPPFLKELSKVGAHSRHGGFAIDDHAHDQTLAVVAHGGTLAILLGFLLKIPPFPVGVFSFELTAVARLQFKKQGSVYYPQLVIPAPHLKQAGCTSRH